MNTPAHLIIGTAVFAKADRNGTYLAALLGAFAPDFSLYVMVFVSLWVLEIPASTVFNDLYYSDSWQSVFAIDNSFVLWGILLALAVWRNWHRVMAFAGAGVLHLLLDFPLHTHDARMHFWPVTDWVFVSPVSYWDSAAHASIVGPMELSLSLALALLLWRRFQNWRIRATTALLVAAELLSSGIWRFVF